MRSTVGVATGAALVLALSAGTAGASQWWVQTGEGKLKQPIPAGETVSVPSTGKVTVKFKPQGQPTVIAECTLNGTEALTNSATEALGETRAIAFSECTHGLALAPILPWSSVLLGSSGDPFTDQISQVAMRVSVEGVTYGAVKGSLAAEYGDSDPPLKDDLDNLLKIQPSSGTLSGPAGALKLVARIRLGVKGVDGAAGEPLTFGDSLAADGGARRFEAELAAAAVTDSDRDD